MRQPDRVNAADVIVFLGPSLSPDEARRILPARYLPPVRCGDVLHARRLKPRAIAIIDGLFELTAAVWHKEILLALEDGTAVFGASSMGALRAAELEPFGMIGIGAIFERYRDGTYTDDDEVALLHGPPAFGYPPFSEPMVNIRATIAAAIDGGVIRQASGERVIRYAKDTFYQERSLTRAVEDAWKPDPQCVEASRFRRFLDGGGYVDQKRRDALDLLTHLARLGSASSRPRCGPTLTNKSCFLRRLHYDVMCDSFESGAGDLPRGERVAREARTLESIHPLRRLAQLMAIAHNFARIQGLTASVHDVARVYERHEFGLGSSARTTRWARARDMDAAARASFVERLARIGALIAASSRRLGPRESRRRYEMALLALLRLDGRYESWRPRTRVRNVEVQRAVLARVARTDDAECGVYKRSAVLWSILDEAFDDLGLTIRGTAQTHSDDFRRQRGLATRDATLKWQRANDLDQSAYENLVALDRRLSAARGGHAAYWLGQPHDLEPNNWLLDVIRLTGLYAGLKRKAR